MVGNFLNGTNFQGGAFGIRIGSINKVWLSFPPLFLFNSFSLLVGGYKSIQ